MHVYVSVHTHARTQVCTHAHIRRLSATGIQWGRCELCLSVWGWLVPFGFQGWITVCTKDNQLVDGKIILQMLSTLAQYRHC